MALTLADAIPGDSHPLTFYNVGNSYRPYGNLQDCFLEIDAH